jgi:tetratricopeptide (TPR) repeat protein
MVVATFRTVFPSVSIWNTIFGDYLLLGRLEPTPIVRYWIGIGYLNREVWPDGLAQFQRALQARPGHRPSLLGTSLAYLKMGQAATAFDLARQLVAEDPREAAAFYIAGLAAEALQSRPQAISLLGPPGACLGHELSPSVGSESLQRCLDFAIVRL